MDNKFKVNQRVVVVAPQIFQGRSYSEIKVGDEANVLEVRTDRAIRLRKDDGKTLCIDVECLADAEPSEDEIKRLFGITPKTLANHCPSCTCEEAP